MNDPRVRQLAEVLVDYSTRVKKGDVVLISAAGFEAAPLVRELYILCLERGAAYVEYEFTLPEINRHFYNKATKEQLAWFPEHKLDFMKKATVYIGISAAENSMVMAQANQASMIAWSKVMRPVIDQRVKHTRWVITRYPTHGAAQEAKMSLEEYEDYLFSACCIDWATESRKQEKLKRLMDRADRVRIKASDTDLSFSLKGHAGHKMRRTAATSLTARFSPLRSGIPWRGTSPTTAPRFTRGRNSTTSDWSSARGGSSRRRRPA